jgi:hypothetical protein
MGNGLTNFVPLGSKYWKTVFGGNYHERVLEPLLEEYKIIESIDYGYRTFTHNTKNDSRGKQRGLVGIRYRINPDLLDDKYEAIQYIGKGTVLTAMERMLFHNEEFLIEGIPDINYHVSIDHNKACKWVDSNAELICDEFLKTDYIKAIPDGLKIECSELFEKSGEWSYNKKYSSIEAAKLVAETRNKELFYFKDSFYIADTRNS